MPDVGQVFYNTFLNNFAGVLGDLQTAGVAVILLLLVILGLEVVVAIVTGKVYYPVFKADDSGDRWSRKDEEGYQRYAEGRERNERFRDRYEEEHSS